MRLPPKLFLKAIAVTLCTSLLATNSLFAHSPEVNFWKERSMSSPRQSFSRGPGSLEEKPGSRPNARRDDSLATQYGSVRSITNPTSHFSNHKTIIHIQDIHL